MSPPRAVLRCGINGISLTRRVDKAAPGWLKPRQLTHEFLLIGQAVLPCQPHITKSVEHTANSCGVCLFNTCANMGDMDVVVPGVHNGFRNKKGELLMKKIALALALVVAGLSLGGCFVGKGKAPAPVVTKG
jgi:hypothetical protein